MELLITLFLCGDVMTGRGVDQVLPASVDPVLHERYVKDARRYVELAEQASGSIERPVSHRYVWGDALDVLDREGAEVRVINLETSVTTSDDWSRRKGIHYRMHPGNVPLLRAAGIDACVVANNHVLDWGRAGLRQTLHALKGAEVAVAGAGGDREEAEAPAVLTAGGGARVLVFAFGFPSSGVPPSWGATAERGGVALLEKPDADAVRRVKDAVARTAREGDVVVLSLHWGGNWGYEIPDEHVAFAHRVIDEAGVDVVHGHSSHHAKGIEVHRGRLVLYGCGDLLNDYEGIGGHEAYRPDLGLMYLPTLDAEAGALRRLHLAPMQVHRMRLRRASEEDARWLRIVLDRESRRFGVRVKDGEGGLLEVRWK